MIPGPLTAFDRAVRLQKFLDGRRLREEFDALVASHGWPLTDLMDMRRLRSICAARNASWLFLNEVARLSPNEIGHFFDRDLSTVAYGIRQARKARGEVAA